MIAARSDEMKVQYTAQAGRQNPRYSFTQIFRGGVGHSLVIDASGRLWRARSYEDFATTYTLTECSCEIKTLTPLYAQMREYLAEETA